MLAVVEKLRLSGLYQTLLAPAIDAREARVATTPANATLQRSMVASNTGVTARRAYTPFGGLSRQLTTFVSSHPQPSESSVSPGTKLFAGSLAAAALLMVAFLFDAHSTLEGSPLALAALCI